MPYFCLGCCKFVRSPLATCQSCGHEHDRDHRASEEPIPLRNRRQRTLFNERRRRR